MKSKESYGDLLFAGINTIRQSRFSHYLIEKEQILELNSMKSIAIELMKITDLFEELDWGILYPIYKLYKEIRFRYRRFKSDRKYPNLKRLREKMPA